ncbi:autotransporter outer membrane beta-barrel domain-containing protein [Utexia brackfieldae]|uniref:autotransporter outer membrane beta-barrel domain-containing protein n=1 Tax=Utexia brackfieldae TaxID=3074108 RepID=UPI00370DB54A
MKSCQFYHSNTFSQFNKNKNSPIPSQAKYKLSLLIACLVTYATFSSEASAYSGSVINGQHEQDLTISDGGIQMVKSGGETTNITIDNGAQQLDGGTANNTIINSGGIQNILFGIANNAIINSGGVQSVNNSSIANGSEIYSGGVVNVNQTAHIDGAKVYENGNLFVNNRSDAKNIAINGGTVTVKGNSSIENAFINSGGVLTVDRGATSQYVTVNENSQFYANGEVDQTTIEGGTQTVAGIANNTKINSGTQIVNQGGIADITTILGGTQSVNGTATNTVIKAGEQTVNVGGKANITMIMNQGTQIVNGTASNTTISSGTQTVNIGGHADLTTISGGEQTVNGNASSTKIKSGTQTINIGGVADNTTIMGGSQIVSGSATNTIINSGSQTVNVTGSTDGTTIVGGTQVVNGNANNTTINGGEQILHGNATNTIINSGSQTVNTGANADKTTIAGGTQVVEGNATNTTINNGVQLVNANGTVSNSVVNQNGALRVFGNALDSIVNQTGVLRVYNGAIIRDTSAYNNGFILLENGAQSLGSLSIYENARVVLVAGRNTTGQADSAAYVEDVNLYNGGLLAIAPSTNLPDQAYATVGNINNAGVIRFSTEPKIFQPHTLMVQGNYTGNGGFIHFNGVLGSDDSPIDKLVIKGNTTGTSYVTVNNVGGLGDNTVKGINLITVDGESNGKFIQSGAIQIGAYEYNLVRSPLNNNNWVLRSKHANDGNQVLVPDAGVYLANLYVANSIFNTRLHDRLGETYYTDILTNEKKVTSMWLRTKYGYSKFSAGQSQLKIKNDWNMTQLGGDIATWTDNLQRFHLGLMGGYIYSSNLSISDETDYRSTAKLNGFSYGIYGTWYSAPTQGWYVDTWAQWNSFKATVHSNIISSQYRLKGISASLESGYTFHVGEIGNYNLFLEPQVQGIWQGTKPRDLKQSNGARISSSHDNLLTRLGLRTELRTLPSMSALNNQSGQLFFEVNWLYNSKLPTVTFNEETDVKQDGGRNITELKTGVEGYITPNTNVWFNLSGQFGDSSFRNSSILLGVKYSY